jgi:soluble lytic murein transglycosylase-like protein
MRRRLAVLIAVALAAALLASIALTRDDGHHDAPGAAVAVPDPLAPYDPARRAELELRAEGGLAHVLYAKSPGGASASAERTAHWRPLVDAVAARHGLDPATLEGIVFLESAGRPDARAGKSLEGAVGLTQIVAQTGRDLLGMHVDVKASTRLTRRIARGRHVAALERRRRAVDERFDPRKALEATARYLDLARRMLGRDDLAVVSYHMGIGNLQAALRAYGQAGVPYAQLFFDVSPVRHARAEAILASLGDDSSTYLWRVRAAEDIMRRFRADPDALQLLEDAQTAKNSAEEVLHPEDDTEAFAAPDDVRAAREDGTLSALDAGALAEHGLRIDRRMGELARRVGASPSLYRALRPRALAMLEAVGASVRRISGTAPLVVTSTVRDERYQQVLRAHNREATPGFSLHTTGWAFDVARDYRSRAQARAFQFVLDRLTALNEIAWVREPGAIHVTVAG